MEYGIRAGFVLLRTYLKKYRLETVRKIIDRFAPASENDTKAYVVYVCLKARILPEERIMWSNKNQCCRLLWAMAAYECGRELSFQLFENAYEFAKIS